MSSKDNSILHIPCFFSCPTKQTWLNLTLFLAEPEPRFIIIEVMSYSELTIQFKITSNLQFSNIGYRTLDQKKKKAYCKLSIV